MAESIKKNVLMVILKNISLLVFPLITFPYLSRVLGPEGMGIINFATTFSNYFMLIPTMGISMYGAREIAIARDNKRKLTKNFKEILIITLLFTFSMFFLYLITIISFEKYNKNFVFYLIFGFGIITNSVSIEWLYTGLEKFSYTVSRGIIIQSLYIISIFIFVKNEKDIIFIPILLLLSSFIQMLINFYYSKKFINYDQKFHLKIYSRIKPILIITIGTLASTIQVTMDIIMLGFLTSDWNVGIYNAAIRINRIVIGLLISLGAIFYSRLSNVYGNNKKDEANIISQNWLKYILMIVYPSIIGIFILSDEIILLLAGNEFKASIFTSRLMSIIILFSVLTNFFAIQLYSNKKEKTAIKINIIGVIVGFVFNIIFIPLYKHNGAAIGTIMISFIVSFLHMYYTKKYINIKIDFRIKYILYSLIMGIVLLKVKSYLDYKIYINILIITFLGGLIYFGILFIFKEINLEEIKLKGK
ncbi:O-antigen/teichoic acid export membrane protein [Hypnocyclicus thermotrophus]|uniref:O-antigen/teichoic acid export membrane protein n=1 Tax=Hypnocyclicus thermotrophus TaxID=1627895 RepID=A0AA46I7D2_9FUSO|nr:flippase [Hypnocyclicus thermotrophus]TDT72443.1 O-antigen/teichoic acid export membrane protein [Hypnocyclicus thermotrophus]